jgi:hypothetical protein
VLNYAFSEAALRSAEPFIHSNIDRWLILLGQHKTMGQIWTESIDVADQVNYLVFDILGDLCFGRCFDMKESGNNLRHVIDMMVAYIETGNPVGLLRDSEFVYLANLSRSSGHLWVPCGSGLSQEASTEFWHL